jgi:hypothetical protein
MINMVQVVFQSSRTYSTREAARIDMAEAKKIVNRIGLSQFHNRVMKTADGWIFEIEVNNRK